MSTEKAKKLRRGKYIYRGHTVTCVGYYPPEHKVVWEAEDENGNGFAHSFSLKDTKRLIDDSLDRCSNKRVKGYQVKSEVSLNESRTTNR